MAGGVAPEEEEEAAPDSLERGKTAKVGVGSGKLSIRAGARCEIPRNIIIIIINN